MAMKVKTMSDLERLENYFLDIKLHNDVGNFRKNQREEKNWAFLLNQKISSLRVKTNFSKNPNSK